MKYKFVIIIVFLLIVSFSKGQGLHKSKQIEVYDLQLLLDEFNVGGAILIYDKNKNTFYTNNIYRAQQGSIPVSTYKIPHTIIGLETGVLKNEATIFKWNGEKRALKIWEQDLSLKQAFQKSCVPCYQQLARKIGTKRMSEYLEKLSFGRMYFNDKTIDNFWLIGKSEITPFEQIDFLKKFHDREMDISESTYKIVRNILILEKKANYILSGKTGMGNNVGWFVGYLEKEKNTYYFATKIIPKDRKIQSNKFRFLRKLITLEALKKLNIIERNKIIKQ